MFHNERYMNCCFVVYYVYYGQSLFFRSPLSENARDTKMTTLVTEGARQKRHAVFLFFLPPSFLAPKWMIVEGYIMSNVYVNIVVLAL